MGDAFDALVPHLLVKLGVDPNVLRPHVLLGEGDDRLDRPWCPLLERAPVHVFVQVDGVFPRDHVLEGAAGFGGLVARGHRGSFVRY